MPTHKKTNRRHMVPWTAFELTRLRKYASDGLTSRAAADKLGRSRGAVAYKAMVERIEFHGINQPSGVQRRLARRRRKYGMGATLKKAA